jgi:hypothetical protein
VSSRKCLAGLNALLHESKFNFVFLSRVACCVGRCWLSSAVTCKSLDVAEMYLNPVELLTERALEKFNEAIA